MMLVNPFVFAQPASPMVYSYEGATVDNVNRSTYTFTSASIGAAGAGRLIAVAVVTSGGTPRSVSGVTADGNAMTKGPEAVGGSVGNGSTTWFYLPIASGTTATFVATLSGTALNCTLVVYRLFPVSSTPIDTATTTSGVGTLTDLEVKTSGLALIASHAAGSTSVSWNGTDSPVHDETNLTNDSGDPTNAWSIPTTENNTTRDGAFSGGVSVQAAGISFQ